MTDAQTIMDHEALKRDIKMVWIVKAYSVGISGKKENGFISTLLVVWLHTVSRI